jgi:hypothetical protein
MIQNQKKFKIQTYNVPWSVPILNALFIQNHVIILPLNNHLLTCHLTSTPHLSLPPHRKELESWGFHQGHCIIHIILHQRCAVKKCLTCGPFPQNDKCSSSLWNFHSLLHAMSIIFFKVHASFLHLHRVLYFFLFFLLSNVWVLFGSRISW